MSKALDNEMRRYILSELSIKRELIFSELFKNEFYSSSKFTYHLNWLVKNHFVEKKEGYYSIGKEGKKLMNYVSSGELVNQPLLVVAIILKEGNKILTSCSKKEPLANLYGLSCFGKYSDVKTVVKKNNNLNLKNYKFHGVYDIKTTDMSLHHILFVYESTDFSGELKDLNNRFHRWVSRKELSKLKQFPENEFILDNPGNFKIERDISENTFKVLLK